MSRVQWGNVGEWAAAVGTSAAVVVTAMTRGRDRKDLRELEALRVAAGLGPSGGPPGPNGEPTTYMGVSVFNGSNRTITDVDVLLESVSGATLEGWHVEEIPPGVTWSVVREPGEDDWAKRPSVKTFNGLVSVTFADADGRRWLRTSEAKIRRLKGWRKEPKMT